MPALNRIAFTLWAAVLLTLLFTGIPKGALTGDGREYLLQAHAFTEHASPDLREKDIAFFNAYLAPSHPEPDLDLTSLGRGYSFPTGSAHFDGRGFIRTAGEKVYVWHFWLYSLCVAPFLAAVSAIGGTPETAFTLCNWAFIAITMAYMFHFWDRSMLQKNLLAGLFLLGGTTYYLWWSHPEVFTASLVLLGLMAADDRRYGLAMGAIAAAATQNPPLLFLLSGIGIWSIRSAARKREHSSQLRAIAGAGIALGFALLPVAFYQLTCGVSNPIAATAWADASFISLERLISEFLDLNMGMVVALPAVLLTSTLLLASWIIRAFFLRGTTGQVERDWALPLALGMGISIVMAIPSLSASNWNHGQTIFSRYAYWLSIPITFGLVVCIGRLERTKALLLAPILIALQLATVAYYGVWGKSPELKHVAFKPFVIPLMLHYPGLYNPVPEIFVDRLEGTDTFHPGRIEGSGIYAFPTARQPAKILVRADVLADELALRKSICPNVSTRQVELGWTYINIPRSCQHIDGVSTGTK